MNNTNLILSDESEKMKNRELLEEYFSHSLEMDLLLRLYPDDEDTLYQIVNLLVDTCATNRKLLHIAGDDKPAEVVRSRFMKLNADHGQQIDNLIRGAYGSKIKVFDQTIPRSVRAAEISAVGKSIFQHDPKGKVAEAYKSLTEEVMANAERQLKRVAERGR